MQPYNVIYADKEEVLWYWHGIMAKLLWQMKKARGRIGREHATIGRKKRGMKYMCTYIFEYA